ncbi:hypothetical protein PU560_06445 [Georgenia sp. 10Sc9-8]|uniref:YgjV family protein n=1 Tax=Georgenia halotolerans TaxID=3028317 RepID=A0ABT5TXW3_9MICO|nr:hypothetical protein [Georgenia halotolerans]
MPILEIFGWIGSAVIVVSMMQQRILRLRWINLGGCLIHIVYNGILGVWPMVGLNVVLAVVQIVNLYRLLSTRHSDADYEVVAVRPDDPYLMYLVRQHATDLTRFTPTFHPAESPQESDTAFLIMKGTETVGYVLLHDAGDGVAQVDLDYVTEKYRDLTPGEFVFRRSDALRDAGYRKVVTPPGVRDAYYGRIGFDRVGDRYELVLENA